MRRKGGGQQFTSQRSRGMMNEWPLKVELSSSFGELESPFGLKSCLLKVHLQTMDMYIVWSFL